jgi:hypothetical protein
MALRPDDSAPRRAGDREQLAAMLRAAQRPPVCSSCGPLTLAEVGHMDSGELVQLDLDPSYLTHRLCVHCGEDLDDMGGDES